MGMPAQCTRCGREVPAGARFCPGCGLDLAAARPRLATGRLPSNQLLNRRYMIMRKLAQGGQSAVYLIVDTLSGGVQLALKEMSDSHMTPAEREKAVNDFLREANMLRTLDHPALAKVYDTFVDGQRQFLVMEYVEGHNLEDELIQVGRPLEWRRVLGWGVELCDVLRYLHSLRPPIIYRDLKPANVMLTPQGPLKLIDFGIARWLHPNRQHDTAQLGTDGYAPLEQYNARSEPRSDLYALGASLYHLLTGRVPESAPSRIAGQAVTPIRSITPQVPEHVEHVVLRALNLHARDRYENAGQMMEALQWALRDGQFHTRTAPPQPGGATAGIHATGTPTSRATARPVVRIPAAGPRLQVWPLRLDAGLLEPEETTLLQINIANSGSGQLSGHTETNMRCLTVLPGTIEPDVTLLQVHIDTAGLRPGQYTAHLAVRTNGGDQIIPVRFHIRPPLAAPHGARY